MQLVCKSCGSSELYLKQKGPNVGVYCNRCDKWIKWIGKKELPMFIRKGFKVHDENYTSGAFAEDTLENVVPTGNNVKPAMERNARPNNGFTSQAHVSDAPFDADDYYDEMRGEYEPLHAGGCMDTSYADVDTEDTNVKFCPICSMGTVPLLNEDTSEVILRVVDNVLSVVSKETGEIVGMARINKCPFCGKHLG